jgi:hypothetical protein
VPRSLTPRPLTPRETEPGLPSCLDGSIQQHNDVSAWDPTSRLSSEHVEGPTLLSRTNAPLPGTWLLDVRLMFKKIDVRIQGTRSPMWQNGRYEDQLGFTVFTHQLQTVESPIMVKVGYEEKRISFQAQHLVPETTNKQSLPPSIRSHNCPLSIASVVGTRVIVIGPDLNGLFDYVGQYAIVTECKWPLGHDQACTYIASTGPQWGVCVYFHVNSLCRSLTDNGRPIQWPGPNQWSIV